MQRKDFTADASGELRTSLQGYLTFIPNDLPPHLNFSAELVGQITRAERALGELHALSGMIPNVMLFIRPFMAREAVLSSRIEGTVTELDELLQAEADPQDDPNDSSDRREVQNYLRALQLGLDRLQEIPLSLRLIREVHATLMQGVRGQEKAPGEFRRCPVRIGRPSQSFENARFVPPDHTELERLLKAFEAFVNQPNPLPTVVMAALAHYQFEAIHPFMDGNGRVGRLLINLMFHARGALTKPMLYLSAYLEAHDEEYRDHLLSISQRGTWAEWIDFFARGVEEQSRDASLRAHQLLKLQSQYREQLQRTSQSTAVLQLIDHLFRSPYVTIRLTQRVLDVTPRAAKQNIEKLVNAKILETMPKIGRQLFYRAPEILRILNAIKAE